MQPLDEESLTRIADSYALGTITSHWPATRGIENRNFFLACGHENHSSEYVLTVMERPANAGDALTDLLDACAAAGLPVPAAIRTRNDATGFELAGKPVMLCPRLRGRHLVNPTAAQVEAVGRFLARLHVATAPLSPRLPAYPRTAEWLRARAEACKPYLPWFGGMLMGDAVDEVRALLGRNDVAALPKGAIHGDLFRDNALFDARGLTGVLDFHHASRGFLVYDIAVAANDWCVGPAGEIDSQRLLALLSAYHGIRRLDPDEVWLLPLFLLYAGLAFWLSRLEVAIDRHRGRAERANDPLPFQRIVNCRRTMPVTVDPWLLDQKVAARER